MFYCCFFSISLNAQNNNEFDEFITIEKHDSISGKSDEFSETIEFDEFSEIGDEFSTFNETIDEKQTLSYTRLYWSLAILLFTIIAGIMVRYRVTRKFRALFMITAVVILGFYRGGCPCIISSFQNTYLMAIGVEVNWQSIIWFLGLIPVTYIFGKVWCGWVCQLGALQEFLYIPKIKLFRSQKAQKIMRIMRIVFLIALLLQLTFTKVILFNKIGPFKVAFNLFSANHTGYILLGLLLISSVFIFRPFCKSICPIGLIIGWISKIPGASILGINNSCYACKMCDDACNMDAITRKNKISVLDNKECILCGDCMDACKGHSISFYKKGKKHNDKIILINKKLDIN